MGNAINTTFAEEIMYDEAFADLHIICFDSARVLSVGNGKAHFFYKLSGDGYFHTNLLSHVNDKNKDTFNQWIKQTGYLLGRKETETDLYNTLKRKYQHEQAN